MVNKTYEKNLSFYDLLFVGLGFIIGSGIFALLPFVIKYSKGYSWTSFIIGGLICIFTGMSYAKLNAIYTTNDAEYTWIIKILNFDNKENKAIKYFANIVIWIVMAIGLFTGATILVSQADFIRQYLDINKNVLSLLLVCIPTIINMFGNKYTTLINKIVMFIILGTFGILYGTAIFKGKHFSDNVVPKTSNISGLLKSSFITIFAFNGFQSIVQLSEETKNKKDIAKGIIGSISLTTVIYALIVVSIISILGIKKATNTITPFGNAIGILTPGNISRDIVNILSIIALTNTNLIINLSRSRLLQKLSQQGIAPKFLSKLTSIKEILGIETFSEDKNSKNLPIFSIIAVSVLTFLLTFIKKGASEALANITNVFIFLIFIIVNALVLIKYYKDKNYKKEIPPLYAVLGLITSSYYLFLSPKYLKLVN